MTVDSQRHVARLEIAVKESVPVRVVERLGDSRSQPEDIVYRKRSCREARFECAARNVFHDQEFAAVTGIEIEDGGYTRVREPGQYERLPTEALPGRRVTQSSAQEHLDGD